jgi:translocation and assembly module TamB
MKADVTLSTVQLNASPNARPVGGVQLQDLVLKTLNPCILWPPRVPSISATPASSPRTPRSTPPAAWLLNSKNPWDVTIQGSINFSILQLFNPDLLGAGASILNVTIRGPLTEPQVEGRLELRNASLFLRDVPNGVDNANGLILFDRNRATVQNLSGKSGGGDISFESGSFLGFRGDRAGLPPAGHGAQCALSLREGVSVTADGSLALVGTSEIACCRAPSRLRARPSIPGPTWGPCWPPPPLRWPRPLRTSI